MAIPQREVKSFAALQVNEPETLTWLKTLMAPVEFKVAVTGTRPGVGVSTITLNLALALRHAQSEGLETDLGRTPRIGILDLGGSTFPHRLARKSHGLERRGTRLRLAHGVEDIKVVSLDMLMGDRFNQGMAGLNDWNVVRESLGQIDWDELDLLLIELPPGIEAVEDLSELLPAIDAGIIVTRSGEEERDRIRHIWKFFDVSSTPAIALISNMEGRYKGETVETLGGTFGIPIRVAIPYEAALATFQAGTAPYILAQKGTDVRRTFFDLSEDLVEYLLWLHDEHEDEEDF